MIGFYRYTDHERETCTPQTGDIPMDVWREKRGCPSARQWGTGSEILKSVTEYDSFPYKRWFRGQPDNPEPVVHPRIAGWYPRQDGAYTPNIQAWNEYDEKPRHCFQGPCTLKLPSTTKDRTMGCDCINSGGNARGTGGGGAPTPTQQWPWGPERAGPDRRYANPRQPKKAFGVGGCGRCGGCGDPDIYYSGGHSKITTQP